MPLKAASRLIMSYVTPANEWFKLFVEDAFNHCMDRNIFCIVAEEIHMYDFAAVKLQQQVRNTNGRLERLPYPTLLVICILLSIQMNGMTDVNECESLNCPALFLVVMYGGGDDRDDDDARDHAHLYHHDDCEHAYGTNK